MDLVELFVDVGVPLDGGKVEDAPIRNQGVETSFQGFDPGGQLEVLLLSDLQFILNLKEIGLQTCTLQTNQTRKNGTE
jgi:hypothetical protein